MEFILMEENLIFSFAIAVMLAIGLLEGLANLIGFGLGNVIDSMIPDFELDADTELDVAPASPFSQFLSWLRIGQVPILILLIILLTSFGLIGWFSQRIALNITGGFWPSNLLALPVLVASLPCVSLFGGILAKVMPKEETEAVSESSFIGAHATVTLGKAVKGNPTQARVTDIFGQDHYILIEPGSDGEELLPGEKYKIFDHKNNIYLVEV